MKSHRAIGDAYEHLFKLGCDLQKAEEAQLMPTESICRALFVPPFRAPYIISIHVLSDMAELTYCVEDYEAERNADLSNHNFRWLSHVIDAFDNAKPVPEDLPESFRFGIERRKLTSTQLSYFVNEVSNLQPLIIRSDKKPENFNYRDGEVRRGIIRLNGAATHKFDLRPIDDLDEHPDQAAYYLMLYKLAASVCVDESSLARLVDVQWYFFGIDTMHLKSFSFELIK